MTKKLFSTKNMAKIAILSTLAFLLMFFEFPLPFLAPPFYQIDFSELPVLIGGFAISPLAAVLIELFKNVLNILFEGTSTAFVGELSNFLVGCAYCLPATILYHKNKTRKQAILGMAVGIALMMVVGFFLNLYIVIPAYTQFMNLSLETIISMGHAVFPFVDSAFSLVLFCTTPFNFIKGILILVLTMSIYKYVSPILKRF